MANFQQTESALKELTKLYNLLLEKVLKMTEANKKLATSNADLIAKKKANAEAAKNLSAVEKQRLALLAKLRIANSNEGRANAQLNVELQRRNKVNRELAQSSLGLVSVYDKESKKLAELRKKYKDFILTGTQSKEAARALREQITQLNTRLNQANQAASSNNSTMRRSGGLFRSMTKSILAAGGAMLTFRAAFNVLKSGLNTIIGFEKSMSSVRAVAIDTSESIEEQNKQFEALTKSALTLGSTTAKTASEVAGLQLEFAKLGFSTSEILAATEATISLSIAAGSDLSESAVVAASTIRGFGLNAIETQRVVDVMAKSFSSSALDLQKFKTAMATVAPVAKNSGFELEQVTGMLSVLADAGIDASSSGAALRNIFLDISQNGITLEEALTRINNGAVKNVEALKQFGKRGATVASVLADNVDVSNELTISYQNAGGAAKEMADIMEDNLAGDITKTKSAWEGFILSLNSGSGGISKLFRGLSQAATGFLNTITRLNDGENLRVQNIKYAIGFEELSNKIKSKSIDLVKEKAELEGKSISEAAQALEEEVAARMASNQAKIDGVKAEQEASAFDLKSNGIFKDRIAVLQVALDLDTKRIATLQNISANEIAAGEAAVKAEEDKNKSISALNNKSASEAAKIVQKKIALYKKEIEEKEKIQAKSLKDQQDSADKEFEIAVELSDEELELLYEQIKEEAKIREKAAKEESDKRIKKEKAEEDDRIKKEKEWEDVKIGAKNQALDAAGQVALDRVNSNIDAELNAELKGFETKQKLLDDKLDKGLISEEQFTKKSAAIDLKARQATAKADKKQALFQIAISTLVAVAQQGFITPGAVAAGIAGAISAVVVAAKPIPAFFTGVENFEGGPAKVGEKGYELIDMPGHAPILSPSSETIMNLPAGTNVVPHEKTKKILEENNKSNQEISLLKSIDKKLDKEITINEHNITEKGYEFVVRTANERRKHIDKYFG